MEGPMEEDVEEPDKDMDMGGAPPNGELVSKQAPVLPVTKLVTAGIWAGGRGDQVARLGISSRAQGKAPTVQAE